MIQNKTTPTGITATLSHLSERNAPAATGRSAIADTILEQLGGALTMLGARGIVTGERSVSIGIQGSRKVNRIVIELEPTDTYSVTFQKIANLKVNKVDEKSMLYADQLKPVIEDVTGLRCSL